MKIQYIILLIMTMGVLTGCYEEPDWLADNSTTEDKNFPVISEFESRNGTSFQSGENVELDLRFWSIDPIAEIRLLQRINGIETMIASFGYTPNFREDTQNDQLLMNYTAPPVTEETEIILAIEILNENGLSRATPDPGQSTGSGNRSAVAITVSP